MAGDPTEDIRVEIRSELDVAGRDVNNGRGGGGREAMVQTPTPPTKTDRKLGAAERTDVKEVGRRRRDDWLRGMGEPPWGQTSAPTGEGGASHLAPTEEGETSVGPAIGTHRRRWGQPFGAHRRRVNIRGARNSAPTVEVGASHRRPQAIVAHMVIVAHKGHSRPHGHSHP